MGSFAVCATICCIILISEGTVSVTPPTLDSANVWITLASTTHTDAMCISMTTPNDPFHTCLVGVPIDKKCFGKLYNESVRQNYTAPGILQPMWWCQDPWQKTAGQDETWYKDLRRMHDFPALSSQPEELDTLGSLSASLCFYIDCTFGVYINSVRFDVSPKGTFSNASLWCNQTLESQLTSGISAIALPSDLFLICGEHVWKGIPGKAVGRPCTIGQLTLIHLNRTALIVAAQRRVRRSTQALNEKCDPMVTFWNTAERISASLVPAIGTAHALASLNKLGCWLAKEANATSVALSTMLMDIKSVEHATLQNRAAIEFWLLAQGHGCEDFNGMCCMNLSNHSESTHKNISNLKQLIKQLQQHNEGD